VRARSASQEATTEGTLMGKLDGKTAIVTGAGSGIGKAIAVLFASEGATVICADITGQEAATAAQIGESAIAARCDVSVGDDIRSVVGAARDRTGRLDVLVNNAGIEGVAAPIADCSEADFDRVIAVNLRGTFLGIKHAVPLMLQSGGGSIINVASVAGLVGFAGSGAYCASKGGVVQLTRAAALDYAAQGIRANAICPGVIWTPMVERVATGSADMRDALDAMEPVGRMGTAEEVAAMALYLAGDDAAFVTGAALPIDGGLVAR